MSDLTAAAPTQARDIPLEFRASGGEYFRIWIVNLLLTIVTIGIYSAWAKVRRLRYFYGSTSLDGNSFEYHGKPIAILKGRLIAVAAYVLVAVLSNVSQLMLVILAPLFIFGMPWIIMRARLFQLRMSSWRGLRFNFHGDYAGSLGAFIGWPILASLTLGALWPIALWKQVNYLLGKGAYGTQRFEFLTTKGAFYKFCLITVAIAIGAMVFVVFLLGAGAGAAGVTQKLVGAGNAPSDIAKVLLSGSVIAMVLAYVAAITVIGAYFRASMLNAAVGGIAIGPHQAYSRLKTWPLALINLTNLLGMIVTLGLFYPWAKVRTLRYQLANTGLVATGDLDKFVADANQGASALGEGVSDIFDIDFGF